VCAVVVADAEHLKAAAFRELPCQLRQPRGRHAALDGSVLCTAAFENFGSCKQNDQPVVEIRAVVIGDERRQTADTFDLQVRLEGIGGAGSVRDRPDFDLIVFADLEAPRWVGTLVEI
jgi:hypothetical protein